MKLKKINPTDILMEFECPMCHDQTNINLNTLIETGVPICAYGITECEGMDEELKAVFIIEDE